MRRFLTQTELELALEEVVREIHDESEQIDAVYIPSEVDQLTDEENFVEVPENNSNSQNGDIAGTFEIHTAHDDIFDESGEEDLATKLQKILEKKAVSDIPTWRSGSFVHQNLPLSKEEEQIQELRDQLEGLSPLDIFFKFVDEDVMDLIIRFSKKYAQDNNSHDFDLSREVLLNFLGILILSGYHSLPQTDLYWSLDEDKTVSIVRDCMSRNKLKSIKRNLHLSDNNNLDTADKYTKLRPFFDAMNEKFLQFGIFSFNLSIDEQMVPYFGHHSCKMFIKGKPVRFGFKLWCICSSSGYLYKFIPYAGAAEKKNDLGLGATVVLELLSILKNPQNHDVFFNNLFSSYKLLGVLKTKGFFTTATICENRTSCTALRNVHIKVPSAVIRGEDAILQCFYDLEGDKLYSVKWYRGGWEFFRYSPSEFPPIKQFKIRGLNIREKDSRDTQVVLEKVTKEISGAYSCEVTADQPSFFTDVQTAELKVVELPKKDPQITGLKTRYKLEDTIKANCTSEGSHPAANLTWYINGIPVEEKFLRYHRPTLYNEDNLVTAHSTIKLKVVKNLFIKAKMKLRCSATMHHLYHKSSEKSIELQRKRHRSPYIWLDASTTTESPFEQWEIPAERPPQATVEFFAPVTRSNSQQIRVDSTMTFILFSIISYFIR